MRQLRFAAGAIAALACACSGGADADADAPSDAKADAATGGAAIEALAGVRAGDDADADLDTEIEADAGAPSAKSGIAFNGAALEGEMLAGFVEFYGVIPDGAYWYDPVSGLVGVVGGPSSGQIVPNLPLGALPPNASGGGDGRLTAVFINGREIHPSELMTLTALFGAVNPGRYWLWPSLVGGYEGGPPMFDLKAAAAQAAGGGAGSYGGGGAVDATGQPGYNTSTAFGDLMSDGQCSGYFDPSSGASVMTGNC